LNSNENVICSTCEDPKSEMVEENIKMDVDTKWKGGNGKWK
jgi:hypothetical protein